MRVQHSSILSSAIVQGKILDNKLFISILCTFRDEEDEYAGQAS
jgi:hypothetical protein